jgi:hypothetical protein
MEDSIRVIFWILVGLVWFISAIAKKRQMGKGSIPGKRIPSKPAGGEVYQAPEEELARFLKMFTGEEETIPAQEPQPALIPAEVEEIEAEEPLPIEPEPREPTLVPAEFEEIEALEPLPVEPVEIEGMRTPEEPSKHKKFVSLPALSRLSISDLQRGIVLSEILTPPRAMRPHRYPRQQV